jgi:uncharacterized protein (TIGR04255 family)
MPSSQMLKASFEKAPLTEVICGVTFSTAEFSSVHFGLYWQSIRDRYPSLPTDTPPMGDIPLLAVLPKLRRVWFSSEDRCRFIQLQSDKFLYNWRRSATVHQYPHFEEVYRSFEQEWQQFHQWWDDVVQQYSVANSPFRSLNPIQYELTYLNHIDQSLGWNDSEDTQNIFSFLVGEWSNFPLGKPETQNINLEFSLPGRAGILSLVITQVVRLEDNAPVLICELTARSSDTKLSHHEWFKLAHESVVQTFIKLLQEETKAAWGFKWLDQ